MRIVISILLTLGLLYADAQSSYFALKKSAYKLYEGGDEDAAIQKVKAFIRAHPQSVRAQNLLAVLYYWQGEKTKAKAILEKIVASHDFPEAKRLLLRLQSGTPDKKRTVFKNEPKVEKKADQKEDDLAYLLDYIQKHPDNIEVRKFLLRYYLSINDHSQAKKLAREILEIDPDEGETLAMLKREKIDITIPSNRNTKASTVRDEAIETLNRYKAQKAYSRYMNLYQALVHQDEYLPRYVHLDALNIAVELKAYRKAKAILLRNHFPNTPNLRRLRAMLDKKLKVAFTL